MKDVFHSITNFVDHNRYMFIGIIIAISAIVGFSGCQAKTFSLVNNEKVNKKEFVKEAVIIESGLSEEITRTATDLSILEKKLERYQIQKDAGLADLSEQEAAIKNYIAIAQRLGLAYLSGGTSELASSINTEKTEAVAINNTALISCLTAIGLLVDNRRKDKIIKDNKTV